METAVDEMPDFNHPDVLRRRHWAERIIELHNVKSTAVQTTLTRLTKHGLSRRQQGLLKTRLSALANSRRSWETYIAEGCPRRRGAPVLRRIDQYV